MMTLGSIQRPMTALALVAVMLIGCGSTAPMALPASPHSTGDVSAPPSPAPQLTPGTSPTPVPESSAGPAEGVFRTQLVLVDGSSPLPVVLHDLTGLVSGIGPYPGGMPVAEDGVANPDGRPNVLTYSWVGGACDTVTTVRFERSANGFRLLASTETTGGICILIGLGRTLEIRLVEPIDADSVIVNIQMGA